MEAIVIRVVQTAVVLEERGEDGTNAMPFAGHVEALQVKGPVHKLNAVRAGLYQHLRRDAGKLYEVLSGNRNLEQRRAAEHYARAGLWNHRIGGHFVLQSVIPLVAPCWQEPSNGPRLVEGSGARPVPLMMVLSLALESPIFKGNTHILAEPFASSAANRASSTKTHLSKGDLIERSFVKELCHIDIVHRHRRSG
eukprot:2504137-Prymnesium_polylepis.1